MSDGSLQRLDLGISNHFGLLERLLFHVNLEVGLRVRIILKGNQIVISFFLFLFVNERRVFSERRRFLNVINLPLFGFER